VSILEWVSELSDECIGLTNFNVWFFYFFTENVVIFTIFSFLYIYLEFVFTHNVNKLDEIWMTGKEVAH